MPIVEASVNNIAVVAAAAVSMVIGAAWYSPLLFGKLWMKLSGMTEMQLAEAKKPKSTAVDWAQSQQRLGKVNKLQKLRFPSMAQAVVAGKSESKDKKANTKSPAALHEPERCLRCGEAMVETYCKVICTNCGYMRDCNDQW